MGYFAMPAATTVVGWRCTIALKLGLELVARRPTPLSLGTFFESWIATQSGTVRRSLGRDEYHLGLIIGAGQTLAATGRTHICQIDREAAGLGPNAARPAAPVDAEVLPGAPVLWSVRTNRFLTLSALREGTAVRIRREEADAMEIDLDHPQLVLEATLPGRYILDLSALLPGG
jgi:hypothetical protein